MPVSCNSNRKGEAGKIPANQLNQIDIRDYKRLKLSVIKKTNFRSESGASLENDPHWKTLRREVLKRDDYTCYYCGFRYHSYMEVHHNNGDWANNSPENLITVCPFCHSCLHIGLASIQGRGKLILLNQPVIQSGMNRLLLDLIREYAPDRQKVAKAVDAVFASIDMKEDLGEAGLQDLANIMAAGMQIGAPVDDVREELLFFPNVFRYNITNYILTNSQKGTD